EVPSKVPHQCVFEKLPRATESRDLSGRPAYGSGIPPGVLRQHTKSADCERGNACLAVSCPFSGRRVLYHRGQTPSRYERSAGPLSPAHNDSSERGTKRRSLRKLLARNPFRGALSTFLHRTVRSEHLLVCRVD